VHDLVYCPYWNKHFSEQYRVMLDNGRKMHEKVIEELRKRYDIQPEVSMSITIGNVVINGRADAVGEGKLFEIKPYIQKNTMYPYIQLSIYYVMALANNLHLKPVLVLYKNTPEYGLRIYLHEIKPDEHIVGRNIDNIVEIAKLGREAKVVSYSCGTCPLVGRCRPDFAWTRINNHYHLIRSSY